MTETDKASLFSKKTNGKFYNDEKKVVGTSPWYKIAVGTFALATLFVFSALTALITSGQADNPDSTQMLLYLDEEWQTVNKIPGYIAYIGWVYIIPLVFGVIAAVSKKYSETKQALFVISGSVTALLLWVLSLFTFFGLLI